MSSHRSMTIALWTGVLLAMGPLDFPPGTTPAAGAQDDAWVPVTILYHSDVKGHIEPCG